MATVYSGIQGLNAPEFDPDEDYRKLITREEKYVKEVAAKAKKMSSDCPEAGEEIRFGVADGYARYIVLSLKPVKLIHLQVGDAWNFQYVNRLTAKDVREEIRRRKGIEALFPARKGVSTAAAGKK